MAEILLLGLAVVVVYLVAHYVVVGIERRHGRPLGIWRTVIFFAIFLLLLLGAMRLVPALLGTGAG